jgi:hypothetical protein
MNIKCTYVWSAHQQKIEQFVFLVIYHYYQIHCKKHNNINTHIYVRRIMFVKFITCYLPSTIQKILKHFEINEKIIHFQNNNYIHKEKKFQYLILRNIFKN